MRTIWSRNFILLTISNFLMCSAYYSLISTLPLFISHELKANNSIVGLVMSSYAIAAIVIRPFTGFGLDYFGRKMIFIISLLIYALIFNAYIFVAGIWFLLFVRFMHGITWGLTSTSNSTLAGDIIPPEKRAEGFGYFGVTTTAGMALGPPIGALVLNSGGYHAMFLTGFFLSIAAMILASMMKYQDYKPSPGLKFSWKNLFESRSVTPSINLLLTSLSYGGLMSFIALYGKELGVRNPSGFFLIYALGVIAARFSAGKAVDRNGPKKIIITSVSMLIVGFPLLALVKHPIGYYIAALILGYGNGVVWPTFQAMVNSMVEPERRGAANSTAFISLDLGMGLGMLITGIISQHYSISAAFMVCSVFCAAGLVFFLTFTLKHYLKHVPA